MTGYFNVLIRGGNWDRWVWDSSYCKVEETPLDSVDMAAMAKKVIGSERSVRGNDGSYTLDGCLTAKYIDQGYLSRAQKIARQMLLSCAGGIIASGALVFGRQWMKSSGTVPYFFLIFQVFMGGMAILSAYRRYQIYNYIGNIQKGLSEYSWKILADRATIYANLSLLESNLQQIQNNCLHSSECKALFQQRFAEWSKLLLDQNPKTEEECQKWIEEFFKPETPLTEAYVKPLFKRSVKPTEPQQGLRNIFWRYSYAKDHTSDYKPTNLIRVGYALRQHEVDQKLLEQLDQKFPQIQSAFARCTTNKNEEQRLDLQEYRQLAYQAAANSSEIQNYYATKENNLRLLRSPDEFCYLKFRKFLEQVGQFIDKGLGEAPQIGYGDEDVITLLPVPFLSDVPSSLDAAFYSRAKKLVPSRGSQAGYEKFIDEIQR